LKAIDQSVPVPSATPTHSTVGKLLALTLQINMRQCKHQQFEFEFESFVQVHKRQNQLIKVRNTRRQWKTKVKRHQQVSIYNKIYKIFKKGKKKQYKE